MLPLSSPTLLTAEAAQKKIEYIQAELFRVQRACEFRDEHPYDPAETHGRVECGSDGGAFGGQCQIDERRSDGTTPRAAKPGSPEHSKRKDHTCSNSTRSYSPSGDLSGEPHAGHTKDTTEGCKGGGSTRQALSFSEFERRRIAQLLGRVAVEITAVWTYVHQWSSMSEASAAYADTTPLPTSMNTAHRWMQQPSEWSVTTTASASDKSFSDRGEHDRCVGSRTSTRSASQLFKRNEVDVQRETVAKGSPEAQMAALNTLIHTVMSIQRILTGKDDRCCGGAHNGCFCTAFAEGRMNLGLGVAQGEASFGAPAGSDSATPGPSSTQFNNDSSIPPPSTAAELGHTLPASSDASPWPPPKQPDDLLNISAAPSPVSSAPFSLAYDSSAAAQKVSIPEYLKGYVWESSERSPLEGVEGDKQGGNEDADTTVVEMGADRRHFRSASGGSATGADPRSLFRVSDIFTGFHVGSHRASPRGPEVSLGIHNSNTSNAPLQGNAGSINALQHFDSDMGFMPASPLKLAVSGSSSLIGSPVQAQPYSPPRLQGESTSSTTAQPLGTISCHANPTHHNNGSSGGRSPDSAEMSPAAIAAYSRSTSLLRRPHRLEVPLSRTQSLRCMPSYISPTSVTSGGGSSPGAAVSTNAAGNTFYSHAHAPTSNAAKTGSGSGGDGYVPVGAPTLTSSPPVCRSASTTGDSPHSSIVGLHFKRVISVDSENGGWPPGSLADSLEMSHPKAASPFGRPRTLSCSTNTVPNSAPQEMVAGSEGQRATTASAPTELAMLTVYPSSTGSVGADVGGASTASSVLNTSSVLPGRADSFRSGVAPARAATSAPPPTPPPSRPTVQPNGKGKPTVRFSPPARPLTANAAAALPSAQGHAVRTGGVAGGRAQASEAAPLPPHSYKIDAERLANFLQCVRGLLHTEFSEEEFDSMHLCYFLPGVSLAKPSAAPSEGKEGAEGRAAPTASSASTAVKAEAPLPLFHGGERVPVRLTKLDVFYSLVKRKVQEVCDNVQVPSDAYLSLL
ncbi:hypothetical protein ABL78_1101 [Leptomonas seymouri]|uniref:Uncharacterized protein n=1 Tax=Leptomonas seymouri TaxID=5684 RepID=A0A0N1I180_LEPSE|nr:hypothetical protein ABL78_1101 [Leptomonas seymouri]|eukprot:KPI89838.1 hypothetical protein ABL78_1101 [Leptomonas seymouri]